MSRWKQALGYAAVMLLFGVGTFGCLALTQAAQDASSPGPVGIVYDREVTADGRYRLAIAEDWNTNDRHWHTVDRATYEACPLQAHCALP